MDLNWALTQKNFLLCGWYDLNSSDFFCTTAVITENWQWSESILVENQLGQVQINRFQKENEDWLDGWNRSEWMCNKKGGTNQVPRCINLMENSSVASDFDRCCASY